MASYHEASDFSELYESCLTDLIESPEYESSPRGLKIYEETNVSLVLTNPLSSLFSNERRSSQKRYIAAELLWYFTGRNDVAFIKDYAKFWEKIQNEDGTVNSAYGNLIFSTKNRYGLSQYEWAYQCLAKDKESRQAVLHFNLPVHQYLTNKDFVCTMYAIFHIREDRLNLTVHMRSNDIILGLPTDFAFFTTLQSHMLMHLQKVHKNLSMGTYTHIANSLHLYETHFNLANEMLSHQFTREELPPVSQPLINLASAPTAQFKVLLDHRHDPLSTFSDPLYNWIYTNINQ